MTLDDGLEAFAKLKQLRFLVRVYIFFKLKPILIVYLTVCVYYLEFDYTD